MNRLTRRSLIQVMAASGASVPLASACQTMTRQAFFEPQARPIGIQLYTLVDMLGPNLEGALAAVAEIGYRTVEIPSYMGRSPAQLRTLLDRYGLTCTAAHISMNPGTAAAPGLRGDLGRLIGDMQTLGATHVYAPAMAVPTDMGLTARPDEGFAFISRVAEAMGADRWKRMADELSAIGARLASGGVGFGYHNHNFEFVRVGERTGFDILVQESDPRSVSIELDVGWAAAAGQDPVALFERYSGRYTAIHMKDIKASTQPNTQLRMDPSDVGSGKLDWKRLLPAAHAAGVRNFFLEQEPPFATSRLDAARAGFAFLSALEA